MDTIFTNLSKIKSLDKLNVSGNEVGQTTANNIDNYFGNKKDAELKHCIMNDCGISFLLFGTIMLALINNTKLKIIEFKNNHLGIVDAHVYERAKERIMSFMLSNKSLVHLDLSYNNMPIKVCEFFVNSLLIKQS